MATDANFNSEYMLESDEGSPLPSIDFGDDLDALTFLDATKAQAGKPPYPTPAFAPLAVPASFVSPQSLPESRDSLSATSSSSSNRTGSSFSNKSAFAIGDFTMSDGPEPKDDWKMSDFIRDDDEEEDMSLDRGDGTINPSTIDNAFQFGAPTSNHHRHPKSMSNSPPPYDKGQNTFTPDESLSPNELKFSPPPEETQGQMEAHSQYSLTKSMHNLKTNGSRETSPWKDVSMPPNSDHCLDPAPQPFLNTPSPSPNVDFGFQAATGQAALPGWPSKFNSGSSSMPQNALNGMAFHGPPDMQAVQAYSIQQQQPGPGPYNLKVDGGAAKSRVETQIRIKLILYPIPPGVRRLHLPTHTISKPKLLAKPTPQRSSDMLELHTALVCTSAMQDDTLRKRALQRARASAMSMKLDALPEPGVGDEDSEGQDGAEVQICSGCMTRERKRAARKKIKKPEDEELWMRDEDRRIVVFNSQEIRDWAPRQEQDGFAVDIQMRIACYCRHHSEKLGFQVIFTITDYRGRFVAQAMSSSIMITDDHKTHTQAAGAQSNGPDSLANTLSPSNMAQDMSSLNPLGLPYGMSSANPDMQMLQNNVVLPLAASMAPTGPAQPPPGVPAARMLSRPASPSGISGPLTKKRKASGSMKVPTNLSMTRLDTEHLTSSPPHQQASAPVSSAVATSPFSPQMSTFSPGPEPLFGQNALGAASVPQAFTTGPPTPNSNDQAMFANGHRPSNYDAAIVTNSTQLYSAPASSHPSRAPSPGLRNGSANGMQQQANQFTQAVASSLYSTLPMGLNAPPSPPSVIHKIIPAEGPKSGGIEVTILGSGFHQGLEVMFGDVRATTTTYWGESSLVCLLPPSPHATTVLVSFKQQSSPATRQFSAKQQPVFKYTDDDEQQLMRTALTVLGHKMNGNVEDISDIARRIIGDMNSAWGQSSSAANSQHGGAPQFNNYSFNTHTETQLLKVLELIDLDDSPHKPRFNLRRSTGQTMLHLACSLGYHRYVAGLLARGANPDVRDKGGYTPLHMAALNDHPEIVRRLITYGADPTIRTLSSLTASDVAQSREVVRAIRRVERHARSRSGGSLHSRTSSLTSLKSVWEPPSNTKQVAAEQTTSDESETGEESPEYSGEESPEYSSENLVSEDDPDADDGPWMHSRRPSTIHSRSRKNSSDTSLRAPRLGGLHSPAAAVTAFKDQFATQFHQFQQAMALHLQNLPQFPYLPQMPTMSPLADYQAYLNSAAVLQRLSSIVPNIGGSRPGSAVDQPLAKEIDSKWWYTLTGAAAPPPPAYEEIYPQDDLDQKQASAAQAAAEAEADHKCATLYDQTTVASSSGESSQQYKPPALLQIGRKNAITKEQQENLQRARAEKLKKLGRDRNLFFIWIPLLLSVLCAMLYSRFPGLFSTVWNLVFETATSRLAGRTADLGQNRVVEIR